MKKGKALNITIVILSIILLALIVAYVIQIKVKSKPLTYEEYKEIVRNEMIENNEI